MKDRGGFTLLVIVILFTLLSSFALALAHLIAVDTTGHDFPTSRGLTTPSVAKQQERLKAFYAAWSGMNEGREYAVANPELDSWSTPERYIGSPDLTEAYTVSASLAAGPSDPDHRVSQDLVVTSTGRKIKWPYEITADYSISEQYQRGTSVFASSWAGGGSSSPAQVISESPPGLEGLDKDMGVRGDSGITPIELGPGCAIRADASGDHYLIFEFPRKEWFNEIRFLNRTDWWYRVMTMWVEYWDDTTQSWVDSGEGVKTFPVLAFNWCLDKIPYNATAPPYGSDDLSCRSEMVYNGDKCSDFEDSDGDGVIWEPKAGVWCSSYWSCSDNTCADKSYIARFYMDTPRETAKVKVWMTGTTSDNPISVPEMSIYYNGTNIIKANHGVARVYFQDPPPANEGGTQHAGTVFTTPTTYE